MTRSAAALLCVTLCAVALAGCAAGSNQSMPSTAPPTASDSPSPTATPTATPTPTAPPTQTPEAATCENIITPDTLTAFADAGWTADKFEIPWQIVEDLAGGASCTWGDYSTATDNVSWLAWAPLPTAQAEVVATGLLNQGGWRREDGDGGIYITADGAGMVMSDEQGYGMTYFFTEGQVKAATTKAELGVITAPPGFVPGS